MNSAPYSRNLFVKALVLQACARGSIRGKRLIQDLEARCPDIQRTYPDFDFVHWVGATVYELFGAFAESGFITHSGPAKHMDDHEWSIAEITITERGRSFLKAAMLEMGELQKLLEDTLSSPAPAQLS